MAASGAGGPVTNSPGAGAGAGLEQRSRRDWPHPAVAKLAVGLLVLLGAAGFPKECVHLLLLVLDGLPIRHLDLDQLWPCMLKVNTLVLFISTL